MHLSIDSLTRHADESPGDILHVAIESLVDDSDADATDLLVNTRLRHRDIRIEDGSHVIKIRLDSDGSVYDILVDDRVVWSE